MNWILKSVRWNILMLCMSGFGASVLHAQYEIDALRFSRNQISGSARFVGMGGAFGALGGDFSTVSTNPAGIGIYRSSQFVIAPSLYFATSGSDYQGNRYNDDKFNFNFGTIGAVFSKRFNKTKTTRLQFVNIGFGYNRTNNLNRSLYFEGTNDQSSLGEYFRSRANGINFQNLDPFAERMAFDTYLIDTSGGPTSYVTNGAFIGESKLVSRQINTRGSAGDIVLNGAANWGNKFFFGVTFAVTRLTFRETSTYSEVDQDNSIPVFRSLSYTEDVDVDATGLTLKFGAIYRPTNWLRIGASFHSPTWYTVSETYFNTLQTQFDNPASYSARSPVGEFEYDLHTPWRAQGSLGFVIRRFALIGFEYEFTDYSNINLRPVSQTFIGPNKFIDSMYVGTHNIRVGAELRFDPYKIRAGYAFSSNPIRSDSGIDATQHNWSLGLGYKSKRWFSLDLSYMLSYSHGQQALGREFPTAPPADVTIFNHNMVFTFGIQF